MVFNSQMYQCIILIDKPYDACPFILKCICKCSYGVTTVRNVAYMIEK